MSLDCKSSNWKKQRIKVARIHEHIQNARLDYLHKVSTEIVKNHDIIGIEGLQISNMLKDRKFSKGATYSILEEIDKDLCFERFENFKDLHDKEIERIKVSKSKLISSMGI